jgi:hypothetical protein
MKQAREHSFELGITSNTDWNLARRSPVHVWLVDDNVDDINRIVAAVGNKFSDPSDITTAADYDVLQTAGGIGESFKAAIYPVNAYQLPDAQSIVAGIGGVVAPMVSAEEQRKLSRERVKQHSGAVQAQSQYCNIDNDNVRIRAEMVEEDEGGPIGNSDYKELDAILSAKALLEMKQDKHRPGIGRIALHGTGR